MVVEARWQTTNRLDVQDLEVWRGLQPVLTQLSFCVGAGELLHVRGPNGAGKTSLLRTLAGFLWPEQGTLLWNGQSIHVDRARWGLTVSYLGHDNALKSDLSALENLRFATALRHSVSDASITVLLARLGLPVDGRPSRSLSAGQRRRVAMARVVLSNAPLWLLDEPFTNLDTAGAHAVVELLTEHASAGGIAVLAAHGDQGLERARALDLV